MMWAQTGTSATAPVCRRTLITSQPSMPTATSTSAIDYRFTHLRDSRTERLRTVARRLGDQLDHHIGKPAVLGSDGRGNGRGWNWTVAGKPSRQQSHSLELLR